MTGFESIEDIVFQTLSPMAMLVFTEFIFDMIRDGVPFDDRGYAKLLTELTERNPTQIPSLVEKTFSG